MSLVIDFATQSPRVDTEPVRIETPGEAESVAAELALQCWCNHQERYRRKHCRPYFVKRLRVLKDPETWTTQDLAQVLDEAFNASEMTDVRTYEFDRTFSKARRRDPARLTLTIRGEHLACLILPATMPVAIIGELVAASWKFSVTCTKREPDEYTFSRGRIVDPRAVDPRDDAVLDLEPCQCEDCR